MRPQVSNSSHEDLWETIRGPKSVAIYGASTNPNKIGGRPIDYMKRFGFQGRIIPINPSKSEIQGLKAFPNLRDAGDQIDAAIVVLPGELAVEAVTEAAECGARLCVVIASGFGEGDDAAGGALLRKMVDTAHRHGMRIVGPNAQGLACFETGTVLSFSTLFNEYPPLDGPVGIVSQSGAMTSVPYAMLRERGIGVRYAHATGNDGDLTVADLAISVLSDPEIKLLVLYVENLSDADGFRRVAQMAYDSDVPVHVLYGGLSPAGQQAALSHTGALAAGSASVLAFFQRLGMWVARSLEELVDTIPIWLSQRIPSGGKLGALSSSGASCVLVSDAAYAVGLEVPKLSLASADKLRARLPGFAAANNPIDVTSALLTDSALLGDSLEILNADGQLDALVVALPVTGAGYDVERFADDIQRIEQENETLVVTILPNQQSREVFESRGLIVFEDTLRAVRAVENVVKHPAQDPSLGDSFETIDHDGQSGGIHDTANNGTAMLLDEKYSGDLLESVGVHFARREFLQGDRADISEKILNLLNGGKAVVKGVTDGAAHKSDMGLVVTSVESLQALRDAVESVRQAAHHNDLRLRGILVYEQVEGYYELILGGRVDPLIGPIVMIGLGGKYAELDPDTRVLVPPFTPEYVRAEIGRLRASRIFTGFRDVPALDIEGLVGSVQALGTFLEENAEWVIDAEVNPLIASDQGFLGVDAVVHRRTSVDSSLDDSDVTLSDEAEPWLA